MKWVRARIVPFPSILLSSLVVWWWFHTRLPRSCSGLAVLFQFLAVFGDSLALHEDTSIFSCAIMLLSCIFLTSVWAAALVWQSLLCSSRAIHAWPVPQPPHLCTCAKFGKLINCLMLWFFFKKKKALCSFQMLSVLFVTYYLSLLCQSSKINISCWTHNFKSSFF